jgi:acetolactate synthase-1/2/3 large subunit
MKRTGSGIIIEALKKEGVDVLFGYPGGVVIPVFDELFSEKAIHLVLTRHEQAAVHAADGYARSTGKTGVVLVTSSPCATNTVTGLATANFDAVPLVVITGQVPRSMIGNDAFQEADIVGISRPVTKHNYLTSGGLGFRVHKSEDIKPTLIEAGKSKDRPVFIDFIIDREANVFPMVPPGAAINEMLID